MDYPVLPTEIVDINNLLREHYGIDTDGGGPIWRVSWSNDQYELRLTDVTPKGIQLLWPEIMEMPKYTHVKDRWILERLVLIPEFQQAELPQWKKSYECLWVFKDRFGEPVQPYFEACKFLIELIYAAQGHSPMPRYIDPDSEEPLVKQKERIDKLVEELFGDESSLMMRTVTGEAITVPRAYAKES